MFVTVLKAQETLGTDENLFGILNRQPSIKPGREQQQCILEICVTNYFRTRAALF